MERISETHTSFTSFASILNATSSKLSRFISVHTAGTMISFSQLDGFLNECVKVFNNKSRYNIGALSGNIIISINLQDVKDLQDKDASATPRSTYRFTSTKKKRGYDDSYDRARESVNAARMRLQKSKSTSIDENHLSLAEDIIAKMFQNIRGTNGELVFESLGLSVSPNKMFKQRETSTPQTTTTTTTTTTATPPSSFSTRPQLIIACRLSGGVAIPLATLKRVLSQNETFFDGMITTNVDSLGPEYKLPISDLGKEAESKGQQSMLLFVAVPPPTQPNPVKLPREGGDEEEDSDRPGKVRRI